MDDLQLLDLARTGDTDAYAALYTRHRAVAARVAARLVGRGHADDVVADAFVALLVQVRAGRGPTHSFRAYLLTAVRREAAQHRRRLRRDAPADLEPAAAHPPDHDDRADLVAALGSLPPRWRAVLWRLEVEGVPPRELATELGLTPNAVSALGCRARAGLRAAYLARSAA